MLLTITVDGPHAPDLGFLVHKHPDRWQTFDLAFGKAHVFYPENAATRATVALWVEIDAIDLVRGRKNVGLHQYVNDRPYAASSFTSVAIASVFGSALGGKSRERADVVDAPLPLTARIAALPSRGGIALLERLFHPLGYALTATPVALDPDVPDWGESRYLDVTLRGDVTLRTLLTHLYVLIPVLDDDKHYWVGDDEVQKLVRFGEGWLADHPEQEAIAFRYLKHRRRLARDALARLTADQGTDPDDDAATQDRAEDAVERPLSLHEIRLDTVRDALAARGAARVVDVGCGEGKLVRRLLADRRFSFVLGLDVSCRALEIAAKRLRLESMPEKQRARVRLEQGSALYRDRRLQGFDAAAVVEVIEHLDPPRLAHFERTLFGAARPDTVVITTPNADYNVRFESLPAGDFRHADHRFEFSRAEFTAWADGVAERNDYAVEFAPIGPVDDAVGAPTQMATFARRTEGPGTNLGATEATDAD